MIEKIKQLYQKYRELIQYVFWGAMTSIVNWIVYFPLVWLGVDTVPANIVAWIVSVLFAFAVNKWFVFRSKELTFKVLFKEFIIFVGGRLFSGVLETVLLWLFCDVWHWDSTTLYSIIIKVALNILVIIINFLVSKFFAFKKKPVEVDVEETDK